MPRAAWLSIAALLTGLAISLASPALMKPITGANISVGTAMAKTAKSSPARKSKPKAAAKVRKQKVSRKGKATTGKLRKTPSTAPRARKPAPAKKKARKKPRGVTPGLKPHPAERAKRREDVKDAVRDGDIEPRELLEERQERREDVREAVRDGDVGPEDLLEQRRERREAGDKLRDAPENRRDELREARREEHSDLPEMIRDDPHGWRTWRNRWYRRNSYGYSALVDLPCDPTMPSDQTDTYIRCGDEWLSRTYLDGEFGYAVVGAPEGYVAYDLDGDCEPVTVGSQQYCYLDGVFYITVVRGTARPSQVVKAPIGAVVSSVPENVLEVAHGGVAYLQFDTTFFQADGSAGPTKFRVVENPFVTPERG